MAVKKTGSSGKKSGSAARATRSSAANKTKTTAAASKARRTTRAAKSVEPAPGKPGLRDEYKDSFIPKEVLLLIALAFCVLLMLANFHLCGSLGEALFAGMHGVLGVIGYLFPVFLFSAVFFAVANRGSLKAKIKLIAAFMVCFLLCGFAQLFGAAFDESMTYGDYYTKARDAGGFIGGLFVKTLRPSLGTVGAAVVLIVLTLICLVLISERSLIDPVRRAGESAAEGARHAHEQRVQDRRYRREMRQREEAVRARSENRVSGISGTDILDIDLNDEGKILPAYEGEEETVTPERETAQPRPVNRPAENRTEEAGKKKRESLDDLLKKFDEEEEVSAWQAPGEKRREQRETAKDPEPVRIRQDARTLSEVGAIRDLKGTLDRTIPREERNSDLTPIFMKEGSGDEPIDLSRPGTRPSESAGYVGNGRNYGTVTEGVEKDYRRLTETAPASGYTQEGASAKPASGTARTENSAAQTPAAVPEPHTVEVRPQKEQVVNYDPVEIPPAQVSPWRQDDEETIRVTTANGKYIEREKNEPLRPEKSSGIFRTDNTQTSSAGKTFSQVPAGAFSERKPEQTQAAPQPPRKKPKRPYMAPPTALLTPGGKQAGAMSKEELKDTAEKLQSTLENFGVGVTITNISCGPTVTRYELQPDQGVKVSKIVSLADDIKLNLAAADIRIEAPIPGKSAIGIEVPNTTNQTVYLRDILESESFRKHPSKVAFAVGRDIAGQAVVTDLSRMPHLLIAGATGSGKSICINTLIMSIIYKATPEQVRLIMIDPKVVELGIYNGIPHLMVPVVTDPKKASGTLKWAVSEMTDRYKRFADLNVRDLKGYNEKMRERKAEGDPDAQELPMVVIIVDEFADLMMVAPGEVEDSVCRLAQMARAAGMHLVLATQRPSVNVITGLIKANVPSRIALAVSSGVDSRTIIDMNGAEKLLGKGDMLFYPQGYQKPVRVQGAFVSDGEIEKVVDYLKNKNGEAEFDPDIEARMNMASGEEPAAAGESGGNGLDELFVQAGFCIIEKDKASIGMLQRVFKIGFNRAARIMDQLADHGVVGPEEGTKARQILMTRNDFESYIEANGL